VHNVDNIPYPTTDPASVKTEMLCAAIRRCHVLVLLETCTTDLNRLLQHLHGTHTLIHKQNIEAEHVGKRGYGIAVIAANVCADFMAVLRVAEDLQCIWIRCEKEVFGLNSDVTLGAVYMRPQSKSFLITRVKELFTDFSDELARASQVTPNVVVCGDFNAKIGNLCEVTDAHVGALVACPALQLPRRCACPEINAAGKLLVNIAAAFELVFTTGRVLDDVGQPTYVGYRTNSGVVRNSRPDHVLMSPELFQCVQRSEIKIPDVQSSDHCELSLFFRVKEDTACADWEVGPEHVCGRGMCATCLEARTTTGSR
jgi:exonuclease III